MSPAGEHVFFVPDRDDAIHLARLLADDAYLAIRVERLGESGWTVRATSGRGDHDSPAADAERDAWAEEHGGAVERPHDARDAFTL